MESTPSETKQRPAVDPVLRKEAVDALLKEYAECGHNLRWCAGHVFLLFAAFAAVVNFIVGIKDNTPLLPFLHAMARDQRVTLAVIWSTIGLAIYIFGSRALRLDFIYDTTLRRAIEIEQIVSEFYKDVSHCPLMRHASYLEPQNLSPWSKMRFVIKFVCAFMVLLWVLGASYSVHAAFH